MCRGYVEVMTALPRFDLLCIDGHSIVDLHLEQRKQSCQQLLRGLSERPSVTRSTLTRTVPPFWHKLAHWVCGSASEGFEPPTRFVASAGCCRTSKQVARARTRAVVSGAVGSGSGAEGARDVTAARCAC